MTNADLTASDWYYLKGDTSSRHQTGPVTWEQLSLVAQAGTLTPSDLVWNPALPDWLPAAQISGLLPAAVSAHVAHPGRRHLFWIVPLAALILVGAVLGVYFGFLRGDGSTGLAKTTTTGATTTTIPPAVANTWTKLNSRVLNPSEDPSVELPLARASHSMVYDSSTGRAIMFGGSGGSDYLNDTWAYDPATNTWTDLDPAGAAPAARRCQSMVYDPSAGWVIVFAGEDTTGTLLDGTGELLNDIWAYDPTANKWTDLDPVGAVPSARWCQSMVYDPSTGQVIMFGGSDESGCLNDTWAYDPTANKWTDLDPVGAVPSARWQQAMVYDPRSGRVIMYGGEAGTGALLNDTWAYDPTANAWTDLEPLEAPSAGRRSHSMVYDSSTKRVIVFGGWGDRDDVLAGMLNDTWAYDPAANAWTDLDPPGALPPRRKGQAMIYAASSGRVIMFGGDYDNGQYWTCINDTWAYNPTAEVPAGGR